MQLSLDAKPLMALAEKFPQAKVAKVVSALLGLYIAYLLAQMSWQIFAPAPGGSQFVAAQSTSQAGASAIEAATNVDAVKKLNLFGAFSEKKQEVKPQVDDAPQTRLRLTLAGVVASSDVKTAAAIIERNGKQETYGIGDKITGTRASLEQVFADRVIIKQSGRHETLMLDGINYNQRGTVTKSSNNSGKNAAAKSPARKNKQKINKAVIDNRTNKALAKSVNSLKKDLANDPGKLSDYLKISPKREQGQVVGYRVMPGKSPEFFKLSGLKSGDVAIQINGLDLTNTAEAAQALGVLRSEQEISLLVDRRGEITEILFSIEK